MFLLHLRRRRSSAPIPPPLLRSPSSSKHAPPLLHSCRSHRRTRRRVFSRPTGLDARRTVLGGRSRGPPPRRSARRAASRGRCPRRNTPRSPSIPRGLGRRGYLLPQSHRAHGRVQGLRWRHLLRQSLRGRPPRDFLQSHPAPRRGPRRRRAHPLRLTVERARARTHACDQFRRKNLRLHARQ